MLSVGHVFREQAITYAVHILTDAKVVRKANSRPFESDTVWREGGTDARRSDRRNWVLSPTNETALTSAQLPLVASDPLFAAAQQCGRCR
jgi:hypothetical protein